MVVPEPLGLFEMYTGVCRNGAIPVLNAPKLDGLV